MRRPEMEARAGESGRALSNSVPLLRCEGCAVDVVPLGYVSGPHLRADCPTCKRYLRFVPKSSLWAGLIAPEVIRLPLFEGTE